MSQRHADCTLFRANKLLNRINSSERRLLDWGRILIGWEGQLQRDGSLQDTSRETEEKLHHLPSRIQVAWKEACAVHDGEKPCQGTLRGLLEHHQQPSRR